MSFRPLALVLPVLAFAASTVHGAIVSYDSLAAFNATLEPGAYTETFDSGGSNQRAFSFADGTPTFGYTVSVPLSSSPRLAVYRNGSFIGNTVSNESLLFTLTTGNISAFAGEFFITNGSDLFQNGPVTLTVMDSLGGTFSDTYTPASASGGFRGFTSNGFITSLLLSAPVERGRFNTADNVIAGRVLEAQAIPEPSSLALLGIAGLAGLARKRARRQTTVAV